MKKHIAQLFAVLLVMLVVFVTTLGILYVLDMLTREQFFEFATKTGIIVLIVMAASFLISAATSITGSHRG